MTTRRLAAILAADVVGFSSLMGEDEEGTLARIKQLRREVVEPKVQEHFGRVFKTTGDGILVEFPSPVEAVRCAATVQETLGSKAAEEPSQPLQLRIGINLGDIIIEEDGDVYGDGVNVAARLEQLADPGGISISGKVYEEVRDKLPYAFEDRGEQQVKNIARPVKVYALRGLKPSITPREPKALPLPDKPSIAVLPFTNMSGDPEHEYFADGVVDDIITALSRMRSLFVIARNSSFTYKGRAVGAKSVGAELGVHYVLEGSLRKAGSRVRVTTQLVNAATDQHLWSDHYDCELTDIFTVQDEITRTLATTLVAHLDRAEVDRCLQKRPEDFAAYDYYVRGRALVRSAASGADQGEMLLDGRRMLQRAIEFDPGYAPARAWLAVSYVRGYVQSHFGALGPEFRDPSDLDEALQLARRALELDPTLPDAHSALGWALSWKGQSSEAVVAYRRALELNPNGTPWALGSILTVAGKPAEAVAAIEREMRLDPFHSPLLLSHLGHAQYMQQRPDAAIEPLLLCIVRASDIAATYAWLAAAYAQLGRTTDAAVARDKALVRQPDLNISGILRIRHYSDPLAAQYLAEGLRKAGLPE
jgi:adenylate cyclase